MARDDVERVGADRARGSEDGNALHAPPMRSDSANAATGSVEVSASMRSRMPPWPGRSELESLRPAPRFIHDSKRSPTTLNPARTSMQAMAGMPSAAPKIEELGVGYACTSHQTTM